MFRKNSRTKAVKVSKQLLVAQSDVNRAQLIGAMTALAAGVYRLASSLGSIVAATVLLAGGVRAFRRARPVRAGAGASATRRRTLL